MKYLLHYLILFTVTVSMVFMGLSLKLTTVEAASKIDFNDSDKQLVAKNEKLALYANLKNGDFAVLCKQTGDVWRSNPAIKEADPNSKGIERTNLRSLLVITYCDNSKSVSITNSYISSTKNDNLTSKIIENGVEMSFDFKKEGFVIPIQITLNSNYLSVAILNDRIIEGNNKLLSIAVLPYFGASSIDDQGYMIVPDGCGALINFNNQKNSASTYSQEVYGRDPVLYKRMDEIVTKQANMPVFGIKYPNSSVLAIIDESAAVATIKADVSGTKTSYNSVWPSFSYREMDTTHLQEMSYANRVINVLPVRKIENKITAINYYFQFNDEANYVGMANCYRKYLQQKNSLQKKAKGIVLNFDFLATAQIKKSFLGIPYTSLLTLTTFNDISKILTKLNENHIQQTSITINSAFKGGSFGKINNAFSLEPKAGSKKDFKILEKQAEDLNIPLYLMTNFQRVYKGGNGISKVNGVARNVSGAISKQYKYYTNTFDKMFSAPIWNLASPENLMKSVNSFSESIVLKNYSIGISYIGTSLYADYSRNKTVDRVQMIKTIETSLKSLEKASNSIYIEGSNVYTIASANQFGKMPASSSQFDITDSDIPFYQIAIHGLVDYSSESVNLEGDNQHAILKSIEYGSGIAYSLICQNQDLISRTNATDYYSSNIQIWLPQAIDLAKKLQPFYNAVKTSAIISHTNPIDGVYVTKYENGFRTIVNYNQMEVAIDGFKIDGNNFILLTGDKRYENN